MKKRKIIEEKNPKERALRLLSYRNYTCAELRERLHREAYPPDQVEEVIEWLIEIGYLNDHTTAELWIDYRNRFRPTGVYGLRHELEQRGVNPEIIDAVMNSPEKEYDLASQLAKSRLEKLRNLPARKQYQRIAGLLQRRGFSWDVIYRVLDSLFNSSLDTDL
ncbi:MAG: regulatory protein RecX [Firmicutes bacterium]|nr:regulatory protein RecX [Bacillota bacterium]